MKYHYEGEVIKIWLKIENIHSKQPIDSIHWNFVRKIHAVSRNGFAHDQSEIISSDVFPAYCGSAQIEEFVMSIQVPICDKVDLSTLNAKNGL